MEVCYCCERPLTPRFKVMMNADGEEVKICNNCFRVWQEFRKEAEGCEDD